MTWVQSGVWMRGEVGVQKHCHQNDVHKAGAHRSPTVPAPLSAFPNQEHQGAQLFQTCLEQLAELSCNLEGNVFVIRSAGSSRFHGH